MENLEMLVNKLRQYENETNWFEFKCNNYEPDMIGQDISALANGAAYAEKTCAYMIWGIDDKTHDVVGTELDQYSKLVGNQEIESWLRNLISKNSEFEFHNIQMKDKNGDNKPIVVLIIYKATSQTVTFKKVDYIRVGSYTKKLSDYPQMQAQLWDKIRNNRFEEQYAKQDLEASKALQLLDFAIYFDLKKEPLPTDLEGILHYLIQEEIVVKQDNGLYAITNLGAILFAKKLSDFPRLERKAVRVVQYSDNSRLEMLKEDVGNKGYAVGFEGLLKFVEALLPSKEVIDGAIRKQLSAYPSIALREAIANALIHQDFSVTGSGVVIEIFANRIEITNPGRPLVDVARIIDNPPKSRNEKLASLMRRLKMCEELGTGWDKIVTSCELQQLPTPHIRIYEENTKVTLFSKKDFFDLSLDDKLWACYMHACVKYIQGEFLTNSSLRERFGLKDSSSASISRLIKEATEKEYIKKLEDTAPKHTKYVPIWA
ncbi:MAG: ATP-binding protein [Oscillospiraceae bacterium]